MTARAILDQWTDEAIDKIEAHAKAIAGENPEIVEAVKRIEDPIGWDGVRPPDQDHEQVFRLQAIAELLERVDEITAGEVADPLEVKTVPELRQIAKEEGVEGSVSQFNKGELIEAINDKRSEATDNQ